MRIHESEIRIAAGGMFYVLPLLLILSVFLSLIGILPNYNWFNIGVMAWIFTYIFVFAYKELGITRFLDFNRLKSWAGVGVIFIISIIIIWFTHWFYMNIWGWWK